MCFKMSVGDNIVDITISNFSDKINNHDKIVSVFFLQPATSSLQKSTTNIQKISSENGQSNFWTS